MKIWLPTIKAGSGTDVFTQLLADSLNQRGVSTIISWFPHWYELAPSLMKTASPPRGTDIIHTNSWNGFAFSRKNISLVVTMHHWVHDPNFAPYRSKLQALYHKYHILGCEKKSFEVANLITSVSQFTANRVTHTLSTVDPSIVHNGINHHFFIPLQAKPKNTRFRLLFVGNSSQRKGFDLLMPIMSQLGNNFELYCTGGLRGKSIPYSSNIYSLGRLNNQELVETYQTCDALLFPSRYEGFGYAVCEAMACGLPVVATDCSSLPELIDEGKGGFLCPLGDVDIFAEKINFLAENRQLRCEMGEYNRAKVEQYFTLERMVREYKELFNALL